MTAYFETESGKDLLSQLLFAYRILTQSPQKFTTRDPDDDFLPVSHAFLVVCHRGGLEGRACASCIK